MNKLLIADLNNEHFKKHYSKYETYRLWVYTGLSKLGLKLFLKFELAA
jgi:hypothetical protein